MSDLMKYIGKEKNIVFDLQNIQYLDKETFGRFIAIHKRLSEKGKQLILTNLEEGIMERITSMHLHKLFSLVQDYKAMSSAVESNRIMILKQKLEKPLPPLEDRNWQTIKIEKLKQHNIYVIKFKDPSERFLDCPELMDYSTLRAELKALSAEGKKFIFDLPDKFGYGSFLNSFAPKISEILKEINGLCKEGKSLLVVKCKNEEARYRLREDDDLITDETYTGAVIKAVNAPLPPPKITTQWSPMI
jgi:hypothetical protein